MLEENKENKEIHITMFFKMNPYKYVNNRRTLEEVISENREYFNTTIKDILDNNFAELKYDISYLNSFTIINVILDNKYFKYIKETVYNIVKKIYYGRFKYMHMHDIKDNTIDVGRLTCVICDMYSITYMNELNMFIDITKEKDKNKYLPLNSDNLIDDCSESVKYKEFDKLYKHIKNPKNVVIFKKYNNILRPLDTENFKLQYILPLEFVETVTFDYIEESEFFDSIEKTVNEKFINEE